MSTQFTKFMRKGDIEGIKSYGNADLSILEAEMSNLDDLTQQLVSFRDERDWEQFHNPKDLAIALSIEASELLETFLWKSPEEANQEKIKEELADVLAYALLLAHSCNLEVTKIVEEKIEKNSLKYPVDKFKGSAKKYNEI